MKCLINNFTKIEIFRPLSVFQFPGSKNELSPISLLLNKKSKKGLKPRIGTQGLRWPALELAHGLEHLLSQGKQPLQAGPTRD